MSKSQEACIKIGLNLFFLRRYETECCNSEKVQKQSVSMGRMHSHYFEEASGIPTQLEQISYAQLKYLSNTRRSSRVLAKDAQ